MWSANSSVMHAVKIILMSSGALFLAILVSLSLSPVVTAAASRFPVVWSTVSRPPYLYVIINGIIITIAASSRLHHNHHQDGPQVEGALQAPPPKQVGEEQQYSAYEDGLAPEEVVKSIVVEFEPEGEGEVDREFEMGAEVEEQVQWEQPPKLERQQPVLVEISPEMFRRKATTALSRFGHNRRPAKPSPAQGGGKALRTVAKPKRHETLENTWKAITEGRAMPLTRHLKKSDTWETHSREIDLLDSSNDPTVVKKSETFKERTNYMSHLVSSSRLKKEPSLSQDELNRRVEAFINKFNEEMRLQRQQSIEQFMDKINRI